MSEKRAKKVRTLADKAREELAQKLVSVDAVAAKAAELAAKGYTSMEIAPKGGIDLSGTAAAKEAVAALEREGFKVSWEKRMMKEEDRDNKAGFNFDFSALRVSW